MCDYKLQICFAISCAIINYILHPQNLLKLQITSNELYLTNVRNKPMTSDLNYHMHIIYTHYNTQYTVILLLKKSQFYISALVLN